mgnify:CR=1 FL=1
MQYRAIGVVRGTYVPEDPEQLTRGSIQTEDGSSIEAVVLGRVLTLMRRHLDLSKPHLWVAYPRYRDAGKLHLQVVGVWEPSTLAEEGGADQLPEDKFIEALEFGHQAIQPIIAAKDKSFASSLSKNICDSSH